MWLVRYVWVTAYCSTMVIHHFLTNVNSFWNLHLDDWMMPKYK